MKKKMYFAILIISFCGFVLAQQPQTVKMSPEILLVPAENSSAPDGVTLKIEEPTEDQVVEGPDVSVKFAIENWDLYKEGDHGQHIHFILDNEPYQAHYSSTEPFVFKDVSPGAHAIRAFPSRPWHESVKQDEAFAMVQFYVKEKSGNFPIDPAKPMLVYSRPKGEYLTSKPPLGQPRPGIMVDFFMRGADFGVGGYSARLTVDGKTFPIKSWRPHYVQGLKDGEHTFKLELLKEGAPVAGNFNSTERKITIKP